MDMGYEFPKIDDKKHSGSPNPKKIELSKHISSPANMFNPESNSMHLLDQFDLKNRRKT